MKKITEMTHDEIIVLDRNAIERLIDLACAEAGVPLQDEAPMAPIKPKRERVSNSYKIIDVIFNTRESAEALQDFLRKNLHNILQLDYGKPSEHKLRIEDYTYFTTEDMEAQNRDDKLYAEELEKYNTLKEKYDLNIEQRKALAEPIWKIYNEAYAKEQVRQMLQRESSRYLDLAEGNVEIAEKFLGSAFQDALEKVKDIFNPRVYMTDIFQELQACVEESLDEEV
jgi:hypothetical protein